MRSPAASALTLAVSLTCLAQTGCIKSMLVNGQIASTRKGSGALDTIGDLELVEAAARAGLVQFEGMHKLAPDNADALFLLTKGWTSYGYGFCEDHMEEAQDKGDSAGAEHFRDSANLAYDRAIAYGKELLAQKDEGFDAARKNEGTLKAWLADNFKSEDDAPNLFWFGYAWLAKTSLNKDKPELVADLWVGVAVLERSLQLDPAYNNYAGQTAMAAYHARAASAELGESKKLFDDVLQKTGGKSLTVHLAYATRYACAKQDPALYEKLLSQVINTPDPDPNLRLLNTVAKKRAKRWLTEKRMFEVCSMDPTPNGPVAGAEKKK